MRLADLRTRWPSLHQHEFERLVVSATGLPRASLIDVELTDEMLETFAALAARRIAGEPLQYIEGIVQFASLELLCDDRALIPRPETEQLWEHTVARIGSAQIVVDLCTGSGNLALVAKLQWPEARVLATDNSSDALALAAENGAHTGLAVEFLLGDLFEPLPYTLRGRIDLLLANPPYLAAAEIESLPDEVRRHEPTSALLAGEYGDEILARIAAEAPRWLAPDGLLACEISEFRSDVAAALFADLGGVVENDLTGRPRFVFGRNTMSAVHLDAYRALQESAVIGVPTDTVYGLAASVYSQEGVNRLYEIKQRAASKPLPVLAASLDQVAEIAVMDERARALVERDWPGDVTYIVRRKASLPAWIGDSSSMTVGVRIPAHGELLGLMRRTGPLAVSSANRSGEPEAVDDSGARSQFGDRVAVYLPGIAPGGAPSAVVDITGATPQILRAGPMR